MVEGLELVSNVYCNSFAELCDCFATFAVGNIPKTAKIAENAQSSAKRKPASVPDGASCLSLLNQRTYNRSRSALGSVNYFVRLIAINVKSSRAGNPPAKPSNSCLQSDMINSGERWLFSFKS